jgi:hypothetical protein
MEYINLTPRFYSRDTLAYALANQFPGYPLGGQFYPIPLCFTIIGGYVKCAVPLSGVYAIDETKVRLVRYYYVWIVRDVKTKGIPFFMVTSVRSGVHVLVVLANMKRAEEVARGIFKVRVDKVIYFHDGGTA